MRYIALILIVLISWPSLSTLAVAQETAVQDKGVLIRDISMEGFVLQNYKDQFARMFKPYRNKYLKTADMDGILNKIQDIYEREGFQQLVAITYKVDKHRLVFTALMTS